VVARGEREAKERAEEQFGLSEGDYSLVQVRALTYIHTYVLYKHFLTHIYLHTQERVVTNNNNNNQDDDVLDTWFSSSIFPMTCFGWPHDQTEMEKVCVHTTQCVPTHIHTRTHARARTRTHIYTHAHSHTVIAPTIALCSSFDSLLFIYHYFSFFLSNSITPSL
jgi:hypothetical protein